MSDPFMAMIVLFAGNFAPRNWAFCQGQLLSISQNTALFSLLGTTYGGDGRTTFALPDLRGRVPVGTGPLPGGSYYDLGQSSGSEAVTLLTSQMPAHNHPANVTMNVKNSRGDSPTPSGGVLANESGGVATPYSTSAAPPDSAMAPGALTGTVGVTGGSQPFGIMQPYLGLNYIIALQGIFPSRN